MAAMRSRGFAVVAFMAFVLASPSAHADNHNEAVKAFEAGVKQRENRELEKAVASFRLSLQMEPSIGAYYNVGLLSDTLNHHRESVDAFRKAAALAKEKSDPREKDANDQISRILETHPHVALSTTDEILSAPGLRVVVDGEVVPHSQLNGEVFHDRSSHEIVIAAKDRKDLRIQAKNRQLVAIVLGEPSPTGGGPPPPPTPEPTPTTQGGWGWRQWTSVGLVGAGVLTAIIGAVAATGWYDDQDALQARANNACSPTQPAPPAPPIVVMPCKIKNPDGTKLTTPKGQGFFDEAKDLDSKYIVQNVVVFSIAGLLIAGGAVLFLTAPKESANAPQAAKATVRIVPDIGPHQAGWGLVGSF